MLRKWRGAGCIIGPATVFGRSFCLLSAYEKPEYSLPIIHSAIDFAADIWISLSGRWSERMMRGILFALLTIGGFGLAGPCSAQTATQYPYCIQGEDNPGWSGCSFNTLQECQESAAGTYAECLSNPWYKASNSGAPAADGSQSGANGPAGFGMAGSASVTQYPFCIQGVDNPGWSGCSFNSLQECQASASGTESECLSNPWYKAR